MSRLIRRRRRPKPTVPYVMDDTQELCYPGIMKAIAETNYSGFVGQEFGPNGDPIQAMKIAYDLCNV